MRIQKVPPSDRGGEGAERGQPEGTHHNHGEADGAERGLAGILRDGGARWRELGREMAERLPPQWRTRRRWMMVGLILFGVLALYYVTRPATSPQPLPPGTKVFQVSNRPVLVFAHSAGRVHISRGQDGQVRITENRNGVTDAIETKYAQQGDTITVTVSVQDGLYLDTWVDFDVAVPPQAGVSATVAAGTLEATGLSGPVTLRNTNGAIWATNLNGPMDLTTESGSINTTGVSGQLTATTQNGTITTTDTRLSGKSTVRAESGTINFHGSLDPRGSYLFHDSNGAVGLTLPRDAAVSVDARATSGSINSEFPSVTAVQGAGGSGARGNIGRAPRASLTIQTTSGSIQLLQAK